MSEQPGEPPQVSRWTTQSLLFVATALITNSHLESFYPIRQLAGDGLLGNGLFFMVAGMGVTLSAQRQTQSFFRYYWRRIRRIYPTVLVVVTAFVLLLGGGWQHWTWREAIQNYIYPTPWAFIAFVMVYYVAFYFLLRRPSFSTFAVPFGVAWIAFAYFWASHPQGASLALGTLHESIYWVFWFQCMLLGGCLATIRHRAERTALAFGIAAAVLFGIYVALKALFVTGRVAAFHFTLFPLVLLLLYVLFRFANSTASQSLGNRYPRAASAVFWISSRTLEIYTVQGFVAYRPEIARVAPFPLNIVVFLALLLLLVWGVHALVALMNRERAERPAVA